LEVNLALEALTIVNKFSFLERGGGHGVNEEVCTTHILYPYLYIFIYGFKTVAVLMIF